MKRLPSAAEAACHLGCMIAVLEALPHPKASTAAKAASFVGRVSARLEAAPFQNKVTPWHA